MSDIEQVAAFEQVQTLCREFRRQLKSGAHEPIEVYLDRVDGTSREMLFQNLLHVEMEFRRRQGETPSSDEYVARFPEFSQLIRQAFFESTLMSVDPAVETPADGQTLLFDAPAARKLGEYELLRQVGRGAFGAVYEARHLHRGDVVALKMLPTAIEGQAGSSGDADRLHKFRREFRALTDINHPNLVGMQSLEVDGRQWFLTMDFVKGTDFLSYVRPHGTVHIDRLRSATRQLAAGVIALHQHQIVHRDLKPSNVMVDTEGHVLVLDFGLLMEQQTHADLTVTMSAQGFAGTPRYAAPEQLFGQCDPASDWYAVGVMLFEALAGGAPFDGGAFEVMRAKQASDAPTLSGGGDVPADLAELVDGLLQREPHDRPDSDTIAQLLDFDVDSGSHDSTDSTAASGSDSRISLIGRKRQLQSLHESHQALLHQRQPRVVFIHGRSGEGKTTLASEFLSGIRRDGSTLVLSGRCYDRESVPFKAIDGLIDALVTFLRSRSDEEVESWLPDDVDALAHLFPVLRRVPAVADRSAIPLPNLDARLIRNKAFAALRDVLREIGTATPIVLFIDDLQWGDGDSAAVLRELLQPPDAPAVMLLGTYRSDEAAESSFLQEWSTPPAERQPRIEQLEVSVEPLTVEQCLDLVTARLGAQAASLQQHVTDLFQSSRGNPYLLEQLLEDFDEATGQFQAAPLAEIIDRRLNRLPHAAVGLLQVIAVAGQAVELDEVAAVSEDPARTMATITHMRSERLVRLIGGDDRPQVDTYHDKIRETVLESLSHSDRRRLHLRFVEYLEQAATPSAGEIPGDHLTGAIHPRLYDLAFHLAEADDPRAFGYQLAAGESAVREHAMETAREYLTTAERLLPADADRATRFRLQFAQAEASQGLDQLDDARRYYERALPLAATDIDTARCQYGIGSGLARRGEMQAAQAPLDRALALLGEPVPRTAVGKLARSMGSVFEFHVIPTRLLMRIYPRMSDPEMQSLLPAVMNIAHYVYLTSTPGQLYFLVRAGLIGRLSADPGAKAMTLFHYAALFASNGLPRTASRYLTRAKSWAEKTNSRTAKALAEHNAGVCYFFLAEFERSERLLKKSLTELQRLRHYNAGMSWHWLRHIESVRGDARRIQQYANDELQFGQTTNDASTVPYAEYGLADALSRQGQFDRAIALAQSARDRLEAVGLVTRSIAGQELGRAQLQASDYEAAASTLKRNISTMQRTFSLFEVYLDTYSLYVEAVLGPDWFQHPSPLSRKELRDSRRSALRARLMCGRFPTLRPHCYRVSGRAAVAAGRVRKATRYFDKAIKSAERVGARYEMARTLIDKSWLKYPTASADRRRGLDLLGELHCVLPEAEVQRLDAHDQS
ncbi:Serine/threonine-protein kinase PrkC [Maioricimonas rarisocia]|uniref:Serine/threonine-protein kinase PrkC n=1 Tax=Maioricimonas rarisocia TaxID=2528026 RepID=A0A517ZFP6_9PLAN|nr:serine/threonine-protein kinase [Maioricimonas rarisocia]QDU41281.1 Serine/threonine-protein kinase PrkC [Maioricimonas rarisocia]